MLKFDISKFLTKFIEEAQERLENIINGLLEVEKNPEDEETIHLLKREFHTLKGSAKMLGLNDINKLVHRMEDIFESIKQGKIHINAQLIDYFFKGVDILKVLVEDPKNASHPEYNEMIAVLDKILGKKISAKTEEDDEKNNQKPKLSRDILNKIKIKKTASVDDYEEDSKISKEEVMKKISRKKEISTEEHKADIKPKKEKKQKIQKEKEVVKIEKIQKPTIRKSFRIDSSDIDVLANMAIDLYSKNIFIKEILSKFESVNNRLRKISDWMHQNKVNSEEYHNLMDMNTQLYKYTNSSFKTLADNILDFEYSLNELLNKIDDIKLIPLQEAFGLMEKYVRDMSRVLKKDVTFAISGQDTKIDKDMLEKIQDIILHLVRNAIDHGIEPSLDRKTKSKSAKGLIMLKAFQRGSNVFIEVVDDGKGLDKSLIVKKAVSKGVIPEKDTDKLTDKEIYDLIFTSGFSTKEDVSDISGRGVGMDVVKNNIEQLKGKINVYSVLGEGTTFQLVFPITVAATEILFIELENKKYGIDNSEILTIIPANLIKERESEKNIFIYESTVYHTFKLKEHLRINQKKKEKYLVLIKGESKIGFFIDEVLYTDQVIIKTFDRSGGVKPKYFRGGTIFSSGDIVLIIDANQIMEEIALSQGKNVSRRGKITVADKKTSKDTSQKTILLVEDSLITRDMEKAILEANDFNVVTAVDGYNALQKIGSQDFDLVITDIEMPNMNGLELTENLRKLSKYKKVPIIIVSSLSKPEIKIKGIQKGANAYFVKSEFQEEHFLNTVSHLIGG